MDFLANENFPVFSIRLLRNAGHNVASVIEETPGNKDRDILKRAYEENRIVLTFDRDYGELIYRHKEFIPAGIIFFRFNPSNPAEPAELLLNILERGKVPIINRFTVVERGRIRQKIFYGKK
jgi:predicted nuclease of predicted toxin-antitoxin system